MHPQRLALAAFAVLALAANFAHAAYDTPAAAKLGLKKLAEKKGIKSHEVTRGNVKRLAVNVNTADQLAAIEAELGKGQNVLQIVHSANRQSMHTLAIFDGEMIHLQTPDNFNTWQLNTWGYHLRPSANKMYSAMIHLTPQESQNLRERVKNARTQQAKSPKGTFQDAFGARHMNCASGWCGVPIGEKGEPLWKLAGLHGDNGNPFGFQLELERTGNERVFGLAVYGPALNNFENAPPQPVFQQNE